MSVESRYRMSQERLEELKKELEYLQTVREKEVSEQIKEARSFGDLSENSEYDEAKTEQGKLYSKIAEIKNLIENAVIHGQTTTAIHLRAKKTEDGFAAFSVRDNGQGIPPALLPHLFDYSIRHASPPTGDGKRNMGLGLSVCSAVVKAHGGRLTAHNHPDGAEFIFCLPMPPADPTISTDLSEEETL